MAIGFSDRFLVNGYDLSAYMQSFEIAAEAEAVDATVLSSTYRAYQQGFKSGTLEWSGVFDSDATDANKIHDVLSAAFNDGGTNNVIAVVGTVAAGQACYTLDGCVVEYSVPIEIGELITVSGSFQATSGIGFGSALMSGLQAAGTNNGTSVDGGAATANGGVMTYQVHNDDATDIDLKVQHSTDGSVWADLTGAAANNITAERASGSATVAAGTTVNRYLRAVATVTGGDTFLVSVAFARR
jgi:hypothetical protein